MGGSYTWSKRRISKYDDDERDEVTGEHKRIDISCSREFRMSDVVVEITKYSFQPRPEPVAEQRQQNYIDDRRWHYMLR